MVLVKVGLGVKVRWTRAKQRQKWVKMTQGVVRVKVDLLWLGKQAALLKVDAGEGKGWPWA